MANDIQGNRAVEVNRVVKTYGFGKKKVTALFETTMMVPRGCIYGLLGPSGCGKTTLLRCILGRLDINTGYINTLGKKPGSYGHHVPGKKVGYMPQELALFGNFTVAETLRYFGRLHKMKKVEVLERMQFLLEFLHLPEPARIIQTLSGGQQRRVSFAIALLHRPELLILDEPTVGVDPLLRQRIWEHLVDIARDNNTTIIITTHYIEEARQANLVGLMRNGHLLAESSPEKLMSTHALQTLEDVFLKLCHIDQTVDIEIQDDSGISVENKCQAAKEKNLIKRHVEDGSVEERHLLIQSSASTLSEQGSLDSQVMQSKGKCSVMMRHYVPNMGNIWALFIKNLLMLTRDKGLLLFQFILPAFQIIVFCLCIGRAPFGLDLAVVNNDTSHFLSNEFLKHISNETIIQSVYGNMEAGYESVKQGKTWGLIKFDETYSADLIKRFTVPSNVTNDTLQGSTIHLYLDMTSQQIAYTIQAELLVSFQKFSHTMLHMFGKNPALADVPIQLEEAVYGELNPSFTHFMAPGIIISITMFMATGLTSLSFVIERKQGLMDRSFVAGVGMVEIMIGHVMSQFLVMVGQVTLLLIFALVVFQVPCHGSVVLLVILTLLQGLSGMAIGLLISAVTDQEIAAVQFTLGTMYPSLLLSGIIWPLQAMPYWLRYVSYALPMTYGAEAMRSIMGRGWGITDMVVWRGFLITIGWTIMLLLISAVVVRVRKI